MKIENVEVQSISQAYGTPVYVYSLAELRRSIAEIRPLAQVVRYAMKACSNRSILKEMKAKGVTIDAVSVFEIERAFKAGFRPKDICFTSDVFFNQEDADYCLQKNIYVNCGTLGMLDEYGQALKQKKFL